MRIFAILFLPALLEAPLAAQDTDSLHIDEVSESFQRQWAAAEESNNTKDLLDLYTVAYDTLRGKLARPDLEVDRWIPLGRVLAAKLATLPPATLEAHEVIARQVLENQLVPVERRKAAEKYAYTQAGREAIDLLCNLDCDHGDLGTAIKGWSRAIEVRPEAETLARLAFAHALRKDRLSLAALRTWAESHALKGEVTVEGKKREVYEYLDTLSRPVPAQDRIPVSTPTCEVSMGHYDLQPDDGRYGEHQAVLLPGLGSSGTKELVVLSTGRRVIAVDPSRAEGGLIDEAVEWRYPKDHQISPGYRFSSNSAALGALPYVGATVADGRVFCPMFVENQEAHQQVGRRTQKFLGASVLRALDLATGNALWDTETVEVTVRGAKVPLLEFLRLDKSDFCFGGPPLVRGARLYAALMTSPFTGRDCWALCLDARTGQPLWCTEIGTAPPTKEMSVAQIAEEDGTLVFSTNFGVVAALDSETGGIEWLVKYLGPDRPKRSSHRTAGSPPVIFGSLVFVLPQDCDGLLAFDRWTGLEAMLPKKFDGVPWKQVVHLIGRAGEWLAFSGPSNVALRPLDGEIVTLPDSENSRFGRGAIWGGRLYLPTRNELSIFDTATWKLQETLHWSESTHPGNLLVAESLLVHLSDRLDLYTSGELLQSRFRAKVDETPSNPVACRQLARILESAGKVKESVLYYRRALKAWEKDPAWQETSEGLKKKLADLSAKLGDDFPKE